jgi:hypothetical protein
MKELTQAAFDILRFDQEQLDDRPVAPVLDLVKPVKSPEALEEDRSGPTPQSIDNMLTAMDSLVPGFKSGMSGIIDQLRYMEIAEEEIAKARGGNTEPDNDDPLWRAFRLLSQSRFKMVDFVYRGHCQELLERIAKGDDTRPATDAEMAHGLCETSLEAPMKESAVALYMRIFHRRFPEQAKRIWDPDDDGETYDAYEKVHGVEADQDERWLRKKMRLDWRTLSLLDEDGVMWNEKD